MALTHYALIFSQTVLTTVLGQIYGYSLTNYGRNTILKNWYVIF